MQQIREQTILRVNCFETATVQKLKLLWFDQFTLCFQIAEGEDTGQEVLIYKHSILWMTPARDQSSPGVNLPNDGPDDATYREQLEKLISTP
jgi:sRNA-binding regulator protein Hfq